MCVLPHPDPIPFQSVIRLDRVIGSTVDSGACLATAAGLVAFAAGRVAVLYNPTSDKQIRWVEGGGCVWQGWAGVGGESAGLRAWSLKPLNPAVPRIVGCIVLGTA